MSDCLGTCNKAKYEYGRKWDPDFVFCIEARLNALFETWQTEKDREETKSNAAKIPERIADSRQC